MKNQKNWDADHALAEMRLLIEGAVNLYEGDAMPLSRLAIDYGTLSAANAFDAIGTALYSLLDHIRKLQAARLRNHSEKLRMSCKIKQLSTLTPQTPEKRTENLSIL